MEIRIHVECECGNSESFALKRTVDSVDNYLEVSESFETSQSFEAHQSCSDETRITCLTCGKYQDVLI